MGLRVRPLGLGLGLFGCLLFGWGLYNLLEIGSCGGNGAPPCPASSWPYFLAMPAGIMIGVISIFLGGGAVVFAGIFLTVGLSSVLSAAVGDAADETFSYVFGGMFLFFGLVPVLAIPFFSARVRRAEKLVQSGKEAIGTVLSVHDTNVTVNHNPRVHVRFLIHPRDGSAPFEAEKTVTVSRIAVPRVGDRYPVWFDPAKPSHWAFGTDVQPHASSRVQDLFAAAHGGRLPQAPFASPPVAPHTRPEDPYEKIAKLNDLRMKGAITDEEFQQAKDRLLASL